MDNLTLDQAADLEDEGRALWLETDGNFDRYWVADPDHFVGIGDEHGFSVWFCARCEYQVDDPLEGCEYCDEDQDN